MLNKFFKDYLYNPIFIVSLVLVLGYASFNYIAPTASNINFGVILIPNIIFIAGTLIWSALKGKNLVKETAASLLAICLYIPYLIASYLYIKVDILVYFSLIQINIIPLLLYLLIKDDKPSLTNLLLLANSVLITFLFFIDGYFFTYLITQIFFALFITINIALIIKEKTSILNLVISIILCVLIEMIALLLDFNNNSLYTSYLTIAFLIGFVFIIGLMSKKKIFNNYKSIIYTTFTTITIFSVIASIKLFDSSINILPYNLVQCFSLMTLILILVHNTKFEEIKLNHKVNQRVSTALLAFMLILGITSINNVPAKAYDNQTVTNVNVVDREKLLSVGYTDEEINNINNNEYQRIINMNIIDTTYTTTRKNYQKFDIYVTHYTDKNNTKKLFVKYNITYLTNDFERYNDIIAIQNDSALEYKFNPYDFKFFYTKTIQTDTTKTVTRKSKNLDNTTQNLDKIGIAYSLPENKTKLTRDFKAGVNFETHEYTDFFVSLICDYDVSTLTNKKVLFYFDSYHQYNEAILTNDNIRLKNTNNILYSDNFFCENPRITKVHGLEKRIDIITNK